MIRKPLMKLGAALAVLVLPVLPLSAAMPIPEPLADHLFPPELLVKTAKAVGITAEQEQAMRADVAAAEPQMKEAKAKLDKAVEVLVAAVKDSKPDEQAALKAADDVLAAEREIKRAQLSLLIKLKSALTPEQQTKIRQLRERIVTLEEKKQEAMALADEWKQQGRDLSAFAPLKEKAEAAKEQGDFETVEKILDEVIRRLKTE